MVLLPHIPFQSVSPWQPHFVSFLMVKKKKLVTLGQKKKSCLVVLHRLPLIFENWIKVYIVQKYTTPNFQNSTKKVFFFFENFDLLKIFFKLLLLSTCLHFNTGLKLVYIDFFFFAKTTFVPIYWAIEAIILCSFAFDLKKKKILKKKKKKKICPPTPTQKKLRRTTKQLFFLGFICW